MANLIESYVDDKLAEIKYKSGITKKLVELVFNTQLDYVNNNLSQGDEPANTDIVTKTKKTRDDVDDDDVRRNQYIAEMGGNTRNTFKAADDRERAEFLKRMRSGKSNYKEAEFDWLDWLDGLFGNIGGGLASVDIDMPGIGLSALAPLGLLPTILTTGFKLIETMLNPDEETLIEDMIKALVIQEKVKERLPKVLKE